MSEDEYYVSSIPADARVEELTGKRAGRSGREVRRYFVNNIYVGYREYSLSGQIEHECAMAQGEKHGWEYEWYGNGRLTSAIPYCHGRVHGTARVWGESGLLLGSYTMEHGTGLDLWWVENEGTAQLSEAMVVNDNLMDGYDYRFAWYAPGQLKWEKWWSKGELHGIEREWDLNGELRSGYPTYRIHDKQVDRQEYDRACRSDATLKPYSLEDNIPKRTFPPEVAQHLP